MTRRGCACTVGLLLTTSACVPDRDNLFDPANAPQARLDVRDRTVLSGCDDSVANAQAWPSISAAFRGTCLALDATDSSDPQGTAAAELHFTFERVDSGEDPAPIGTPLQAGLGASVHLLAPELTASLPADEEVSFRVIVRDPAGARTASIARVTLLNRAPLVHTDPLRILTRDGTGSTRSVELRATAEDADGDASFTWRWTGESGSVLSTNAVFTPTISTASAHREAFLVEADDGFGGVATSSVTVEVGGEPLWAASLTQGSLSELTRFGRQRRVTAVDDGGAPVNVGNTRDFASRSLADETLLAAFLLPVDVVLTQGADLAVLDQVSHGITGPTTVEIDPSGRVWVAGAESGGERDIAALLTDGGLLTPAFPPSSIPANPVLEGDFIARNAVLLEGDDAGRVWVAGHHEETIRVVEVSASAILVVGSAQAASGSGFKALAARPGSPGVWALEAPLDSAAGAEPPALVHFDATASGITRVSYPLDAENADGLAWADADRAWTYVPGYAVLVDVSVIEDGGSLEAALLVEAPSPHALADVVVDRSDPHATAWWRSPDYIHLARTSSLGGLTTFLGSDRLRGAFGSGLFASLEDIGAGGLGPMLLGESPATLGMTEITDAFADLAVADGEGGLWCFTEAPPTLTRIGPSGETRDRFLTVDYGQGPVPLPFLRAAASDRRGALFAISGNYPDFRVLRIDVAGRTPFSAAPAVDYGSTGAAINPGSLGVFASASSDSVFWTEAGPTGVNRTDPDGQTTPVLFTGDQLAGGFTHDGGALCIATTDLGDHTAAVHRISGMAPAALDTALTFENSAFLAGGGGTWDPETGEEWCWIGTLEPLPPLFDQVRFALRAYDGAGNLVRSFVATDAEDVTALALRTHDEAWFVRGDQIRVVTWDDAGVPSAIFAPTFIELDRFVPGR